MTLFFQVYPLKFCMHSFFSYVTQAQPITNLQTPWSRALPEKLIGPQLLKYISYFMEARRSLLRLQKSTTSPYFKPQESNPCLPIPHLKIHFNNILPSTPRSSKWYLFFLTFICPCIASISLMYSQEDATFSRSIYFYKLLYMFQVVPLPIIRSTKLYIQRQVLSNQ